MLRATPFGAGTRNANAPQLRKLGRTLLLVLLPLLAAPGAASATDWGIANDGTGIYSSYYSASNFKTLTSQSAMGAAKWQRFVVAWEAAGTANSSGQCVTPTSTGSGAGNLDIGDLKTALSEVESGGFTPIIALSADGGGYDKPGGGNSYQWPAGADTPTNPSDLDMFCAVYEMASTLKSANPSLLPAGTMFESYNEPDGSGIAGACQPGGTITDGADCAARYFGDTYDGLYYAGFAGYSTNIIAGAFKNVTSGGYTAGNACSQQPSYAAGYVCYLENGDSGPALPGGGDLIDFKSAIHGFSYHDYSDPAASSACYPAHLSGCIYQEATNMRNLMTNSSAPGGSNTWMTESGCRNTVNSGDTKCANLTANEQGNEAYDWIKLRGYVSHILWYEYAPDSFDSAILDTSSAPRQVYCVLGSDGVMGFGNPGQTLWNGISCTGH